MFRFRYVSGKQKYFVRETEEPDESWFVRREQSEICSYVELKDPLGQQEQNESRKAQNADDQCVQKIKSQRDPGEARREICGPEGQKSQQRVYQQFQGDAQRRAEDTDQGDEEKECQKAGDDSLV